MTPFARRHRHQDHPHVSRAPAPVRFGWRLRRVVLATLLVTVSFTAMTTASTTVAAGAAVPAQVTTTVLVSDSDGSSGRPRSIPLPNSGAVPADSGERGDTLQRALFFLICGVILGGAGLVWWESRRKRRAQGRLPARR